eukprot:1831047-Amphidinium_carterae.1
MSSGPDFKVIVQQILRMWNWHTIPNYLWSSLYGQQLQSWLEQFPARQFILIPWKYYLSLIHI